MEEPGAGGTKGTRGMTLEMYGELTAALGLFPHRPSVKPNQGLTSHNAIKDLSYKHEPMSSLRICVWSIIKDLQLDPPMILVFLLCENSLCVCRIQDWPSSLSTNDWGAGLIIGPPWTPPLTDSLSSTALCLIKAQSGMWCLQWKQRLVIPRHTNAHLNSPVTHFPQPEH